MYIEVVDETGQVSEEILKQTQEILEFAAQKTGKEKKEMAVTFVSNERSHELNLEYRDTDRPTDVISFDLLGEGTPAAEDPGPDAELYISLDCAQRVSVERGVSVARELTLYAVHGALHLCGFDDHEPEERAAMRVAERTVLGGLGFEEDQGPHD